MVEVTQIMIRKMTKWPKSPELWGHLIGISYHNVMIMD